ncbi:MAG: hypothetical protein IJC88_05990 [Oscillospiraceae bacterium]|nr:hypothetical protein [Oscillospiraceae bacterium]
MKNTLKGYLIGVLSTVLLLGSVAYAANTKTIEAFYNNIKIYVDGVKIEPKDATGKTVEPFIYNGTTYLPVRAVGEAIGKTVAWDGATQSVYLGGKPGDVQYLLDVCPPYQHNYWCETYTTTNGKSFLMGGKKYTNGFVLDNDSWNSGEIYFNLDAKYKNIILNLGPIDGVGVSDGAVVGFYVDGKLIKEYTFQYGDLPRKVTIPVNYGMQLKVVHTEDRDGAIGAGNITVE